MLQLTWHLWLLAQPRMALAAGGAHALLSMPLAVSAGGYMRLNP